MLVAAAVEAILSYFCKQKMPWLRKQRCLLFCLPERKQFPDALSIISPSVPSISTLECGHSLEVVCFGDQGTDLKEIKPFKPSSQGQTRYVLDVLCLELPAIIYILIFRHLGPDSFWDH